MDRQILFAGMCALLAALGCAKSEPPAADRAQNPQASAPPVEGDGYATTHRPVITGEEPSQTPRDAALPPRFSAATTEEPRSVYPIAPLEPGAGEPPIDSPTDQAHNPLRSAMLPPAPDDGPNPLRVQQSFGPTAVPRMAPRISSGQGEFEPQFSAESAAEPASPESAAPPAAGSAPPDVPLAPGPTPIAPLQPPAATGSDSSAAATPLAARQAAADQPSPYDIVQVYYGTDRAEVAPPGAGLTASVVRFLPAGFAVLITLSLGLIAAAKRSSGMLWALAAVGAVVSTGLALQASSTTLTAIRWQDKDGLRYGVERSSGGDVQLGICEVAIPKIHKSGELESPSVLRLEVRDDLARHVALTKTERLASDEFYAQLRERVAASPRKELFVFVHGFDVSFEDAARRTAQIHKDLKFPGAPIFFSWPANNKSLLTYPADENSITWSTPHFKQFLLEIVQHSDAQSINLIAHSMGNRALTVALREIELEFRDQARLFNHVVLAAPDIDAEDFRTNIAPRMQKTAKQFTLYASSRDDALRASQLLHRGPRAGDAGRGLVVVAGIDTIDVSAIDTSPWGHSYYGSSDPVLRDLGIIMEFSFPPQERRWLSPAERDGLTYWIFEPSRTAGLVVPPPR